MYFIGVRSINSLHSEQLVEFRKKFNETSLLCDKKKKARTYIACSQLIIYFKLNFQQSNFFFFSILFHYIPNSKHYMLVTAIIVFEIFLSVQSVVLQAHVSKFQTVILTILVGHLGNIAFIYLFGTYYQSIQWSVGLPPYICCIVTLCNNVHFIVFYKS